MLLFGHVGITLGAALLLKGLTNVSRPIGKREDGVVSRYRQPSHATTNPIYSESNKPSWVESLAGFIDNVMVLGKVLTAEERAFLWNNGELTESLLKSAAVRPLVGGSLAGRKGLV